MKKKFFLIIAAVSIICLASAFLFLLPALTSQEFMKTANDLSDFLDLEGFTPGVSQLDFQTQIGKYSYEGNCIDEQLIGMYYDGPYGGGYQASGKDCGFSNDYQIDQDREFAVCTNAFYTTVQLDNLTLPRDITFADTLSDVCKKLGMSSKVLDISTAALRQDNPIVGEEITLFKSNDVHFTLKRAEDNPHYDYELHYVETYITTRADGREATVTRELVFCFDNEYNKLHTIKISVSEKYKLD